jgi:hypothetical protein
MSHASLSSITHSSSSLHTEDTYETSSPVNDADEIILRGYRHEGSTSLWHDLDRDGVHTPAIPSFILNSPPMGPIGGASYAEGPEVRSLRKGSYSKIWVE